MEVSWFEEKCTKVLEENDVQVKNSRKVMTMHTMMVTMMLMVMMESPRSEALLYCSLLCYIDGHVVDHDDEDDGAEDDDDEDDDEDG